MYGPEITELAQVMEQENMLARAERQARRHGDRHTNDRSLARSRRMRWLLRPSGSLFR